MDADALVDQLEREGSRLAATLDTISWDAQVPGLDWDVRSLIVHTGGAHRWATTIVREASDDEVGAAYSRVGAGPIDGELAAWLREGLADLVAALRAAPEDLDVFTFLPAHSARHFWARRQAHETAVHRADLESVSEAVTPFPVDFAQDGIAEMLHGFAARRRNAITAPGTVSLRPTDDGDAWRMTFGGETIIADRAASDTSADAMVTGSSSDLYLWLWNRPAAQVKIAGKEELARLWTETVRVRWS
jgi:uncharacterized protein (TIGR03083 family)